MRVFIDLDLHEAVQDFSVKAPAGTYEWKSQDTIDWLIYFVRNGIVQDLGAGLALKYGMIASGDTTSTILAYQTSFSQQTDSDGNVYYTGQVVYNTSQMATAISGKTQLPCISEIRYQTSDGEIIHSLNVSCLVFPTILVETGVTPPGVSTGYPDASTIELLVHRNAPSGYAGLDSSSHLNGAVIPVDGQTIQIASGKVASAAILAYTAANFTTPAPNGTVSVTLVSNTGLVPGQYVRIPIAGYYIVESVSGGAGAILENNGDPFNAAAGITITSGAVLLPAQAAAGGGTAGQNAYTTLTAGFTVPAVGTNVTIQVASTAWMGTGGYGVYISGAGYYLIQTISDATHAVATNSGTAANSPPGTSVPSGVTVTTAGPMGPAGAQGASLSAYDALTAAFTQPAMGGTVTATISNTAWIGTNQVLYIAGGGYYQVSTIPNATNLVLTNLGYAGNAAPGATVASGSKVSPGGIQGAAGAGGAGLNAYTTLTSNFTQPTSGSTVTITVGTTAWMASGQGIYVTGGGYYTISAIGDATHVTVTNLGSPGNPPSGTVITGSGTQIVSPAGVPGITGGNAYTVTTASFTQPGISSNVTVSFGATAWMAQNQYIFINGGGYYQVVTIGSSTSATIQNIGSSGNLAAGSTVPSNAAVSPAGPIGIPGVAGPTGPTGPVPEAPTDGQTYGRKNSAWTPVTSGGGGAFDPRTGFFLYDDFLTGASVTPVPPEYVWSASGGTFAGNSSYGYDATRRTLGSFEISTGFTSAANQGGCLTRGFNSIGPSSLMFGFGLCEIAFRLAIEETTLPATGVGYTLRAGFYQQNTAGYPPTAGTLQRSLFLEYSPDNNSGNLRIGSGGGSLSYVNCSSAVPTPNAYGWWSLKIDASGNVTAFLNGVSIGSASALAPLNAPVTPILLFYRGTGSTTNYAVCWDALYINYPFTR